MHSMLKNVHPRSANSMFPVRSSSQLNHSLDYSRTLTMVITVPYTKGSSQCDTEPNTYVILQTSNKPHIVKNTLEMHEPIKRKPASSINTPLEPCISSIKSIKINTKIFNK